MLSVKTIERKLELAKRRLSPLLEREEHLSKYGFWEIGYLKGQISVLEDWLDELLGDNIANNQELQELQKILNNIKTTNKTQSN